ncbi:MAG: hypothetical protein ACI398_02320 [Clostridium sp.]
MRRVLTLIVDAMEELDLITINAIEKYYSYLENIGYIDNDDMNNILILSFINDIVKLFSNYITDDDYTTIVKALLCLSDNSCLISAPHFLTQESLFKDSNYYKQKQFRISEDSLFRQTEDNNLRIND